MPNTMPCTATVDKVMPHQKKARNKQKTQVRVHKNSNMVAVLCILPPPDTSTIVQENKEAAGVIRSDCAAATQNREEVVRVVAAVLTQVCKSPEMTLQTIRCLLVLWSLLCSGL